MIYGHNMVLVLDVLVFAEIEKPGQLKADKKLLAHSSKHASNFSSVVRFTDFKCKLAII